jgi:hypothetical protein
MLQLRCPTAFAQDPSADDFRRQLADLDAMASSISLFARTRVIPLKRHLAQGSGLDHAH